MALEQHSTETLLGVRKHLDLDNDRQVDLMLARQGVLADEHPLNLYVQELHQRLHPDSEIPVYILDNNEETNAFATSDGRILLTRKLLEFCESDEEVMHVLHHEYWHIKHDHHKRLIEKKAEIEAQKRPMGSLEAAMSYVGLQRITELMEANIESLLDLDRKGINIDGAFTLSRRMAAISKGGDLAHGSPEDELLAFKTMLLVYDLESYQEGASTPKPEALKDPALYEVSRGFPIPKHDRQTPKKIWAQRGESIKNMDAFELLINYKDLKKHVSEAKAQLKACTAEGASSFKKRLAAPTRVYLNKAQALKTAMWERLKELLKDELSPEQIKATHFLERTRYRMQTSKVVRAEPKFFQAFECLAEIEDLEAWAKLYKPGLRQETPLEDRFVAIIEDRYEAGVAKKILNIVSMLTHGKWFEGDKTKLRNKNVEEKMEKESETLREILRSTKRGAWEDLDRLAFQPHDGQNPSQEFKELYPMLRSCFSTTSYKNFHVLGQRALNLKKNHERNRALAILSSAARYCPARCREKIEPEQLKAELSDFVTGVQEMDCPDEKVRLTILKRGMAYIYGSAVPSSLEEMNDVAEHLLQLADDPVLAQVLFGKFLEKEQGLPIQDLLKVKPLFAHFKEEQEEIAIDQVDAKVSLRERVIDLIANGQNPARNKEELKAMLELLADKKPLARDARERNTNDRAHIAFYELLKTTELDPSQLDDAIILLRIQNYAADPLEAFSLERNVWETLLDNWEAQALSVKKLLDALPEDIKIPFEAMQHISEDLAESDEELEACAKYLKTRVKDSEEVGKSILLQKLAKELIKKMGGSSRVLIALLRREEDSEIKNALIRSRKKSRLIKDGVGESYKTTGYDSPLQAHLNNNILDSDTRELNAADLEKAPVKLLKQLHTLDELQKRLLIHELLSGPRGLIHNPAELEKILDVLFEEYLQDDEDQELQTELQELIKAAIHFAKPEDRYLILAPLLAKRILQAPIKDNWQEQSAVKELQTEYAVDANLKDKAHHMAYGMDYLANANYDWSNTDEEFTEEEMIAIIKENTPDYDERPPEEQAIDSCWHDEILNMKRGMHILIYGEDEEIESLAKHRVGLDRYLKRKAPEKVDKMGPAALIVEIAESLRSIGTRGLQVADMYMDLPEGYHDLRSRIYSDMQGQPRLTAFETIKKQVPAEHLQSLKLGKRKGGGSMVTVYPFKSDNMEGVIKVLNPNVASFTESTFNILRGAFNKRAEAHPEHYAALNTMLDDLYWWVVNDMNLKASADLDEQFAAHNHGTTAAGIGIEVPQVLYRDERCLIEATAPGISLDKHSCPEEEKGQLLRSIQESIRRQVLSGIMHSDIHPGNLHLHEGKLAWLDRTLLLQLRPQDQMLLFGIEMAPSDDAKIAATVQGLLNLPENAEIPEQTRTAVLQEASKCVESDLGERLKKLSVALRKHEGFTIPPHLTLVFNNMLRMAKFKDRIGSGA